MGPGVFASEARLPRIGPYFFYIPITIHVVATNARGASASVDVPVRFR
jgi:hypothetical protein